MLRHLLIVLLGLSLSSNALAQEPAHEPDATQTPPVQEPDQVVRPVETAQTPSTIKKIITNFWHDQKGIWTSPAHIDKDNAKWWVLFGTGTAALIATDHRTSNAISDSASQISFSKRVSQVGADYVTLPISAGLYFYGRHVDNPKAREVGVLGAQTLLDSAIAVEIMKKIFGRERPELVGGNGRFFKGKDGFPSGHAIETWSFASLISHEYGPSKAVPVVAYGLATVVSVARFTGRKHYASDILAGGAMGWFIGRYVFNQHLDPNIHKRFGTTALKPQVSPMFDWVSHSYGLSLAWHP